jgi:hypothetical protein
MDMTHANDWRLVTGLETAELIRFRKLRGSPLAEAGEAITAAVRHEFNVRAVQRLAGLWPGNVLVTNLDDKDIFEAVMAAIPGTDEAELWPVISYVRREYVDMLVNVHLEQRLAYTCTLEVIGQVAKAAGRPADLVVSHDVLRANVYRVLLDGNLGAWWDKVARLAGRTTGLSVEELLGIIRRTWDEPDLILQRAVRALRPAPNSDQVRTVVLARRAFRDREHTVFGPPA